MGKYYICYFCYRQNAPAFVIGDRTSRGINLCFGERCLYMGCDNVPEITFGLELHLNDEKAWHLNLDIVTVYEKTEFRAQEQKVHEFVGKINRSISTQNDLDFINYVKYWESIDKNFGIGLMDSLYVYE